MLLLKPQGGWTRRSAAADRPDCSGEPGLAGWFLRSCLETLPGASKLVGLPIDAELDCLDLAALGGRLVAWLRWQHGHQPGCCGFLSRLQLRLQLVTDGYVVLASACCCAAACVVLLIYGGLLYAHLRHVSRSRPPASFRRRTRATCWSTFGCPIPRRWSARSAVMERDRGTAPKTPRRQAHGRHRGTIDPARRQRAELRLDVRDARRFPRIAPSGELTADAIAAELRRQIDRE